MGIQDATQGYHSLMFLDDIRNLDKTNDINTMYRHTYDTWHMVPMKRPSIEPPNVRDCLVDLLGSDGFEDSTDAVAGRPLFGTREGSIEFMILNDYKPWIDIYTELLSYFHGKPRDMILEDDRNYFYRGRFSISNYEADKEYSTITLNYKLQPYKRHITSYINDWLWDTFNFNTDARPVATRTETFSLRNQAGYDTKYVNLPPTSAAYLTGITLRNNKPSENQHVEVSVKYVNKLGKDISQTLAFDTDSTEAFATFDLTIDTNSFEIVCTQGYAEVSLTYSLGLL